MTIFKILLVFHCFGNSFLMNTVIVDVNQSFEISCLVEKWMQSSLKEEQGIYFYFVTHNHWALSTIVWKDTSTFVRKFPRQIKKHHLEINKRYNNNTLIGLSATVYNLSLSDSGIYICETFTLRTMYYQAVNVIVYREGMGPFIDTTGVKNNKDILLAACITKIECYHYDAHPSPYMFIYVDGIRVNFTTFMNSTTIRGIIFVDSHHYPAKANYSCEVFNPINKLSKFKNATLINRHILSKNAAVIVASTFLWLIVIVNVI